MKLNIKSARQSAKQAGKTYYFTGKPCKKGHTAKRITSNGNCVVCQREHKTNYEKRNVIYAMYERQRIKAKQRGIEWLFTYETWLEFWEYKLEFKEFLVMGRFYDLGPYSPENCYLTSREINSLEYSNKYYHYEPWSK